MKPKHHLLLVALSMLSASSVLASSQHYAQNDISVELENALFSTVVVNQFNDSGTIESNHADVYQSGVFNATFVSQYGHKNHSSVVQRGSGNLAVSSQYGANHSLDLEQNGSSNLAVVTQYGFNKTDIELIQTGNKNTAYISTSRTNGLESYSQNGGGRLIVNNNLSRNIKVTQGK